MTEYAILGSGDVGRRLIAALLARGVQARQIHALSRTQDSVEAAQEYGVDATEFDLDSLSALPDTLHKCDWVYLVPPPKQGTVDTRSRQFLDRVSAQRIVPSRVVLISTTGVYGDAAGEWIDENSPTNPQTERGQRRLDMEQQWNSWADKERVKLRVLRVPGIYANSRIPLSRLESGTPVVKSEESGFSNRIHADDLAGVCIAALEYTGKERLFNVTDGTPGKISDYLQAAAKVAGLPALPEISMSQAQDLLSPGMLSYLSESRRISNRRMLQELDVTLRFPDFRVGLQF